MSYADKLFKELCSNILLNGTDTKGQKVRPIWTDTNEPAYTKKIFGVCNRYDLRKEFPAITVRRTAIKSATEEVLWIYQKKSNNIKDLNSHIWDSWADENGSIGTAYGYQIKKKYIHHFGTVDGSFFPQNIRLDQMDAVLYDLKHTPFSRRIMTNMYNFEDLNSMHLYPCAYSCTWNVTDEGDDKLVLNLLLNHRSNDVIVANNWNVVQYAILLMMVAQVSNMIAGELVVMISDAHIYDRHFSIAEELINRPEYDAPKVTLDPDVKDFYHFTKDSVIVKNYKTNPQIENIPVAV